MTRFSKKQWLYIAIVVLTLATPLVNKSSSCVLNDQCAVQQKQVNWISWLIGHSGGQLHFFDLLELFHKPNKSNHF